MDDYCFYCNQEVSEHKYRYVHKMYNYKNSLDKPMVKHVTIPRCKTCYSKHEVMYKCIIYFSMKMTLVIAILFCIVVFLIYPSYFYFYIDALSNFIILSCTFIGPIYFFSFFFSQLVCDKRALGTIRNEIDIRDHSLVATLINDGWEFNERVVV